jgi:hypothetical protein
MTLSLCPYLQQYSALPAQFKAWCMWGEGAINGRFLDQSASSQNAVVSTIILLMLCNSYAELNPCWIYVLIYWVGTGAKSRKTARKWWWSQQWSSFLLVIYYYCNTVGVFRLRIFYATKKLRIFGKATILIKLSLSCIEKIFAKVFQIFVW